MKKRKKRGVARLFSALLGFVCALVLGALFYGAMVYQLGGIEQGTARAFATPAPLAPGQSAQSLFPGPLLALPGDMTGETARDVTVDGVVCRVVTRTYSVGGVEAAAISATPAAYMARLAQEGFLPQLITGFSLAGLDAVCEEKGEQRLLAARQGDLVYMLEAQTDDQTLYALGAQAALQ